MLQIKQKELEFCTLYGMVLFSYTRQKKKRTNSIFPLGSPFKNENVNCHELFISDQILLKL